MTDHPLWGLSVLLVEALTALSLVFSTTRWAGINPQSLFYSLFLSFTNQYTEMKIERDLERQDWSVRDGAMKKKRSGGRARYRYMQRERVELKVKEGEREMGCIFILWSVSIDGDKRSKHASPLSPWSVSMETLFFTLTHKLRVQS